MAAYHIVLVHFPIAFWTTAALILVVRALSDGGLAKAGDRALVPLLTLSVIMAVAAYAVGTQVWSLEAITSSPLGRNHMLAATWSVAYWTLVTIIRWRAGAAVWDGPGRWIMLGLGVLGVGLMAVTGALGGHLVGTPTAVSQVLRFFGWEIYTTFYVPNITLIAIGVGILALIVIGLVRAKQPEPVRIAERRPAE
jgi:hypothetical protein